MFHIPFAKVSGLLCQGFGTPSPMFWHSFANVLALLALDFVSSLPRFQDTFTNFCNSFVRVLGLLPSFLDSFSKVSGTFLNLIIILPLYHFHYQSYLNTLTLDLDNNMLTTATSPTRFDCVNNIMPLWHLLYKIIILAVRFCDESCSNITPLLLFLFTPEKLPPSSL